MALRNKWLNNSAHYLIPKCSRRYLHIQSTKFGIDVTNDDGEIIKLCHLQTRENCETDQCKLYPSRHRNAPNLSMSKISDAVITSAVYDEKQRRILFKWSDDHEGFINADTLFRDKPPISVSSTAEIELWNECPPNIANHNFNDIMNDDMALLNVYDELDKYGIIHIDNASVEEGTMKRLAERMSIVMLPTIHGDKSLVEYHENTHNLAFDNGYLVLHTDLPYYDDSPNYFMFHCIENDNDGLDGCSIYCDGWNIIEKMETNHFAEYNVLKSISVPFADHQRGKWNMYRNQYIIDIDENNLYRLHYNEGVRSTLHWDIDHEEKLKWYNAFKIFSSYVENVECHYKVAAKPGGIIIINNRRVMHGRNAFTKARKFDSGYFQQYNLDAMRNQLLYKHNLIKTAQKIL